MSAIAIIFIYCGAFLCLLFASGQLLLPSKRLTNTLLALILLALGLNQIYNALYLDHALKENATLLYVNLPLLFALGPLGFFYFRSAASNQSQITKYELLLFAPAIFSIGFYFFGFSISDQCKIEAAYGFTLHCSTYVSIAYGLTILANLAMAASLAFALIFLEKNKAELSLKLVALVTLLFLIFASWAVFLSIEALYYTSVATTLLVALAYLWGVRRASLLQLQRLKALGSQYEYSYTKGLNIENLLQKLSHLIAEEHIHRQPNLTALQLAEELKISKHQLSQLLNQHKEQNFRQLINQARIEDAKKLLLSHPDKTILEIAFLVGFNSKGVFNDIFRKLSGQTPTNFRKSQSIY